MNKAAYTKAALTYQQQLQQLLDRGLHVPDKELLLHLLEVKSYYRLSGYWYPLLEDKTNHEFKEGASFNIAYQMYCFDRELRQLIIDEIEKIEIAVRAKVVYIMSHSKGAYWYTNSSLFSNVLTHSRTINKIGSEFSRSDAKFIRAFKEKYSNPLPPSWTAFEIITLGTLSTLYKNLKPGRDKRDIANFFGLHDRTFQSWLHSIVYVRNLCAHHSRLWNRELRISPNIPRKLKLNWLQQNNVTNNKLFIVLCIINYLLCTVDSENRFSETLKKLLIKYPCIDTVAMGFPENWENEPLWK